jgi:hypothetical protein
MMNGRLLALVAFAVVGSVACAPSSDDGRSIESESALVPNESPAAVSTPAGMFSITLAAAAPSMVNLGEKVDIDVTVTPTGTFAGTVDLGVTGLSQGVNSAPMSVSLAGGEQHVKLTLAADVTSDVTAKDSSVPINVVAKSGDEQAGAAASLRVMPNLTIYIPRNVSALYNAPGGPLRAEWGTAFGPNGKPLRTQANNPIVVTIFNNDTMAHVIHGPGGSFPHGDIANPIQPNAFEMKAGAVFHRTMKVGDSATAYIHGENNSQNASFKVQIGATPPATP